MVSKVIILFMICFSSSVFAEAHFYCHQNSSALYLSSLDKEYIVEDFKFNSNNSNPAWMNCHVFVNRIYDLKVKRFKYKKLMDGKNVRVLSSQFLNLCLEYKFCELKISSLFARPRYIWKHLKKKYRKNSELHPDDGKTPFLYENELIDLTHESLKFEYLDSKKSPIELAVKYKKKLSTIATMTFDSDALEFFMNWSKANPDKNLHVYFAGHLQYLSNSVDLSLLENYSNIILHPIFLSNDYLSSFHMKGILAENEMSFFTLNFKKSLQSLNDLAFSLKSKVVLEKFNDILQGADQTNCFHIDRIQDFTNSFPKLNFIMKRYVELCKNLPINIDLKTSLFDLKVLETAQNKEFFTHILHPAMVEMFPKSTFYINMLSKKENLPSLLYNKYNHFKFIKTESCLYFMSSNLTPTAGGNRGEIAFKTCSVETMKQFESFYLDIKALYKRQDELEILSQ